MQTYTRPLILCIHVSTHLSNSLSLSLSLCLPVSLSHAVAAVADQLLWRLYCRGMLQLLYGGSLFRRCYDVSPAGAAVADMLYCTAQACYIGSIIEPHTRLYYRALLGSYYYICVLILLNLRPHTTIYVPPYYLELLIIIIPSSFWEYTSSLRPPTLVA